MQINNLTPAQVEMLDFMWSELDSYNDMLNWMDTLDAEDRKQAQLLQRMILLEAAEDILAESNYQEANQVIDQFRLTK
jgi:hypothetical protein